MITLEIVNKGVFNFIAQNAVGEFGSDGEGVDRQVYERLIFLDVGRFSYVKNYAHQGHVHCTFDHYDCLGDSTIEALLKNQS